jgi:hypothetical protein
MLDLNKLVPQIQEMTRGAVHAGDERQRRLAAARTQLERVVADPAWRERLTSERVEARMALPTEEALTMAAPAPEAPGALTVVAVDGSQIAPDHHEVAACCLINVGSVTFRYGPSPRAGEAQFSSEPQLIFQREQLDELADGAADLRFGLAGSGDLDALRMIAESARLAEVMRLTSPVAPPLGPVAGRSDLHPSDPWRGGATLPGAGRGSRIQSQHDPAPQAAGPPPRAGEGRVPAPKAWVAGERLALMDGPLIAWPLGWLEPRTRREEAVRRFLEALKVGQELKFPVAGYISRTRSADVVRMLQFTLCEAAATEGRFCPACETALRGRSDPLAPPCFAAIEGVIDIQLMAALLCERGARSAVFESNNPILGKLYGEHRRIGFFFLNAGLEIARVEVPEWVWSDPARLAAVHAAVYSQIRLGMGYPIALSEAHEQAVVRAPERQAFYELLRRGLVRDHLPAETSAKTLRKRGPIA